MTCPACDYELSVDREYCENCGAPTYLAMARESSELTHCTSCGMRGQAGKGFCFTCGWKKSVQTKENAVGLCRNCGTVWRTPWRYCQICGVACENGLVEMLLPSPPLPVVTVNASSEHCHLFNAAEPFSTAWSDASLPTYFAHDDKALAEVSRHENEAVRYWSEEGKEASTSSLAAEPVTQTEAESATATLPATPEINAQHFATPRVQASGQKTRRPLAKHYLTIILILVGVILVFSALRASGIRPEDLLGRLWPS